MFLDGGELKTSLKAFRSAQFIVQAVDEQA